MALNFGSNVPKTTASITFGSPANLGTATSGFALGTPAASTGLTFGSSPGTAPTFALGGGDSSKASPSAQTATVKPMAAAAPLSTTFSLGSSPATTSATTGFTGFGLTPGTTSTAAVAQATPSFSFGATSTPALSSTAAPTFSLTPTPASAPASILKLGMPTTTASSAAAASVTTSLTATAPAALTGGITFVQLESTMEKWKLELDEQEKIFMSQAMQINTWDNLLNSNSEKIVALNGEVSAMKLQQQQLDHELGFIVAQQRELEEVLAPLEKQAAEVSSNTDPEREHTYHMAETLDTQLKQMSEDLREIIENINESSRTQDTTDPVVQIGRVLNAHMNSLQWIDQMTLNIQNQLENVTKLHDTHRRENERSFRISYQ